MLRGQGMQRYLITGAAGNLARQLMDELIGRGKHTFGIDLVPAPTGQQGNWRQMDITDRESLAGLLAEFQPECILHMASLLSMSSAADPPRAWEVNASAAVALMELAVEHGVQRFFFPSTSATYGGALPDPLPEDHPQWPDNIYVRDVTLGILTLVEAPEEPLSRRVYNLHGFAASAGDLAQAAAQRVLGFQYRFEPAELPTRILSVQPSVYTDASARRDWGWHPQFDLPATADHLLARVTTTTT